MIRTGSFCLISAVLVGSLSACGGAVPHEQASSARSAVSAAEASGAKQIPEASLYLKMSKDSIAKAEQIMYEEPEQAKELLERARADAELARSLTDEEEARHEANVALQRVEQLENSGAF